MYSSRAQRLSSKNYGTAATGSYRRFNSLRDAPPVVEGKKLPLRGSRQGEALIEEGRSVRERLA